jgi:hypothetical protein
VNLTNYSDDIYRFISFSNHSDLNKKVNQYFLEKFPSPDDLRKKMSRNSFPEFREANGHIHTPYSFSAFSDMNTIFTMAREENIAALGINDFFVTDGFKDFYDGSVRNGVFPLFNIEFIGLMKEEQKKGIRINDPHNPGRIYFTGKGLDYPFNPGWLMKRKFKSIKKQSQNQIREMIGKLNTLISPINPAITLSYDAIRGKYARELVRERHLAKAVRYAVSENYSDPEDQIHFLESLFDGKKPVAGTGDNAGLENEIRSNLLKSGGKAFVEENDDSFLDLGQIIKIILKAGGIPCYPVLLDDPAGKCTEFEDDPQALYRSLTDLKIGCIELIPSRNDSVILKNFVDFFYRKGFLILFGTEHNTPQMIPLTVTSRGQERLDDSLKRISWESVCVLAAHQYLRAQGRQGYVLENGTPSVKQKKDLASLGQVVIEYYLQKNRS